MKYTILSAEQKEDNLITNVRYDFDGVIVNASVSHFQPDCKEAVELAIVNRAASELRKLEAASVCVSIIPQIDTNIEVEVEI